MSQFEFLLALYAIVAGLGLSLLVRSIGQVIEARDRVRLAVAVVVLPGLVTLNPRVHAAQAVLLVVVMAIAVSYVAKPLG